LTVALRPGGRAAGNPACYLERAMAHRKQLFTVTAEGQQRAASKAEVIAAAKALLDRSLYARPAMTSPSVVRDYLTVSMGDYDREVFTVVFLDAQNRVIDCREMFQGTLTQTSVYPREVVKQALTLNAASVILAHNHPSGVAEPSRADEALTQTLKAALALVDVRVLDHMVVAGSSVTSFAERGLL
jgi:DNA repair protein RadC